MALSVDILVYDINAFKAAYNNEFFVSGTTNILISNSLYAFNFNINELAYFVGHFALTMNNPTRDQINF